jgi:hypothetical protein
MKKQIKLLVVVGAAGLFLNNVHAEENVVTKDSTVTERVEKAFVSKEWRELPDEMLINQNKIKWNRLAKAALNLPEWMEFSLSQRTRFESSSHPWLAGQSSEINQQLPMQSRMRLGASNENFGLIFEGQDSRTNFDKPNELAGNVMTDAFDVLQLFTSASLKNIAGTGVRADVDLGRFSMDIGSSRFIGRNGFEQTTNSFEGGHLSFTAENQWRFRTFMMSLVNRTMYQTNESHQHPLMWGADFEVKPTSWLNNEVYYIGVNDNNAPTDKAFSVFGTRAYLKPIATSKLKKEFGAVDYDFETAVETGETGTKDLFAYMGHAEVGYTFNTTWFPRLMGEYEYASGTENPNGGMNNTLDRLSGVRTNMFITSLFGPTFQSNLEYGGLRLVTQPLDSVKVNVKHHVWYLAEEKDAMAGSAMPGSKNLQDKTGNAGRYLGQDVEFSTSWDLRSNLSLSAGYEHWFKGDYFSRLPTGTNLPAGGTKDTDYFYVSSEVRF